MDTRLADAIKATLGTYPAVRQKYYESVFVAVYDYLDSDSAVTSFRNTMTKAMVEAFTPAAEIGWEDGGGTLPMDDETNAWLTATQQAEIEYINVLFQSLKALRKTEDVDKTATATARATGYARTLDGIYGQAKVRAGGATMLTLVGEDGTPPKYPCAECKKYKGQRHRASWWIAKGLVPYPGNPNYTCRNFQCKHTLVDDKKRVWTL